MLMRCLKELRLIILKQIQEILKLPSRFKGYKRAVAGAESDSSSEGIYRTMSIIKMTNPLKECARWSFSLDLNRESKTYKVLKDLSEPKRLNLLAMADCSYCGYD